MSKTKDLAMIHGAAFYFAYISRDKKQIANFFGVSNRTIERWSKEPEWEHALKKWGYTGERSFITPPRRDMANKYKESYERAKAIYFEAHHAGEPYHKLATIAGEAVDLPRTTIHRWATMHGWRDSIRNTEMQNRDSITFIGAYGTRYQFESHLIWTEFPYLGGVYIFTKRHHLQGNLIYTPLYIGETQSLAGRFYAHHKFDCVKRHLGNTICIHREDNEFLRRKKESDLIASYKPICNG